MQSLHAHNSLLPAIVAAQWNVNDGFVALTLEGAQAILQGIRDDSARISDLERQPLLEELPAHD